MISLFWFRCWWQYLVIFLEIRCVCQLHVDHTEPNFEEHGDGDIPQIPWVRLKLDPQMIPPIQGSDSIDF